jgi:hypothetical protein
MQVGEIAAPAARDQNLFTDARGALQHGHAPSSFAGFDRAHQPGSAGAKYHHIVRMTVFLTHFKKSCADRTLACRVRTLAG